MYHILRTMYHVRHIISLILTINDFKNHTRRIKHVREAYIQKET